jgi:hypothetical protein
MDDRQMTAERKTPVATRFINGESPLWVIADGLGKSVTGIVTPCRRNLGKNWPLFTYFLQHFDLA